MVAREPHVTADIEQPAHKTCPNCGGAGFRPFLPAGRIHREAEFRRRFIMDRFPRPPRRSELKDLTEFAHNADTAILACARCAVLCRDEPVEETERTYADDPYDPKLMDRLFPRYADAFRSKRNTYLPLLPESARVLEIGSHYGAFLRVAGEWGWAAVGIDIGKDTAAYAQSKGHLVFNRPVEECSFPQGFFDGVFVWNCFEQVPDPRPLLRYIRFVLRRAGLLVVRVPNAAFYQRSETLLRDSGLFDEDEATRQFALKAMAYNNLLGFPYLYGYSSRTLGALVSSERFQLAGRLNSELLTLPLPDVPAWVAAEEREVSAALRRMNESAARLGSELLTGPWIELAFRAIPASGD